MRQLGQLRTPEQEFLVQEGTPEQQELHALREQQKGFLKYAESAAMAHLRMMEALAVKHGNAAIRALCMDRKHVSGVMTNGYCVEHNFVEYASEIVAKCGERRFP